MLPGSGEHLLMSSTSARPLAQARLHPSPPNLPKAVLRHPVFRHAPAKVGRAADMRCTARMGESF